MEISERGYVYILSMKGNKKTLKIGCSRYGGTTRARYIKYNDIDDKFQSEFEIYCFNYRTLEKDIHKVLEEHRHGKKRELFDVPLKKAIRALIDLYLKKYINLKSC